MAGVSRVIEGSLVGSEDSPDTGGAETEDVIDLDEWAAGGDNVEKRLLRIAKQMELDALALPVGSQFRGQLLKDSAAIFSRLYDKQKPDAKKDAGGLTPPAGARGGVAVAQISRDDAVGSYMRLIEGPVEGDGE